MEYTTPGNYSITVPENVSAAVLTIIGAGGGGASGWMCGNAHSGGGGGAGAYIITQVNVQPGKTLSIFVGTGGAGGAYPGNCGGSANGADGQLSFVTRPIITTGTTDPSVRIPIPISPYISANGGGGGQSANNGSGGGVGAAPGGTNGAAGFNNCSGNNAGGTNGSNYGAGGYGSCSASGAAGQNGYVKIEWIAGLPAASNSLSSVQEVFDGLNPIGLSEYYYGVAQYVPNTVPARFNTAGAQNSISISQLRGKTKALVKFPDLSQSPAYDFYLPLDYGYARPLKFKYSRSASGPINYSVTFYTTYCGQTPTFTGSINATAVPSTGGIFCETINIGRYEWRKGCCNGNDNTIFTSLQISMTPTGGITASLVGNGTGSQRGC